MNKKELIGLIREYCTENLNEANVIKYSRYFKGSYDAYGLTQTQINTKVNELLKTGDISLKVILESAPELIKSPKYEEASFALLLFNGYNKQFSKNLVKEIESWFEIGINNWAHADALGMYIMPQFLKKEIIKYYDLEHWLTASNKFQRRTVPVSLIKLLKTSESFLPLFDFIEHLMSDPEREVHQGVGWFLREAWKIKKTETEKFLLKWKNTAPRLIIQYATEKMTPEEKKLYKRQK